MSGLGKGTITSSVSKLLQLSGFTVSCVKIDPYVNYDAGTMNPIAHGEVFVTDDGGECDMDIGNYERFLNIPMTLDHNITTGRIYSKVIQLEREGKYLGQCVQIIPHITDEIKNQLYNIASKEKLDFLVVECGGTVGDIESLPFLESFRQMRLEEGTSSTLFIHVTLAPVLDVVGEQKTKPTQHSVQELRRIGIQPDILTVRCKSRLSNDVTKKISLFASINQDCVVSSHDVPNIYQIPETLANQGIIDRISEKLSIKPSPIKWKDWRLISNSFNRFSGQVKIAVVGKYVSLPDSYVSVYHALSHAGAKIKKRVEIDWIESEKFENDGNNNTNLDYLRSFDGILIPGGFGKRGTEGIINVANFARIENIPFLGICFGFQLSLVSFARNVCGLETANSSEIDPSTSDQVVEFLPEQKSQNNMGGTMRLGSHTIDIIPKTKASKIYSSARIARRHRHRYEFNKKYLDMFQDHGMILSGFSDKNNRTEILELKNHRFYFAVQYHAEFSSRPGQPEQSFKSFLESAASLSSR